MNRIIRRLLPLLARAERPAAWVLMIGGFITFVGVILGLIVEWWGGWGADEVDVGEMRRSADWPGVASRNGPGA